MRIARRVGVAVAAAMVAGVLAAPSGASADPVAPVVVAIPGTAFRAEPVITADGATVFSECEAEPGELCLTEVATGETSTIGPGPAGGGSTAVTPLDVSDDGMRLLVRRQPASGGAETLAVWDRAAGDVIDLSPAAGSGARLDRSGDHAMLATATSLTPDDADSERDLYRWSRAGGARLVRPGGQAVEGFDATSPDLDLLEVYLRSDHERSFLIVGDEFDRQLDCDVAALTDVGDMVCVTVASTPVPGGPYPTTSYVTTIWWRPVSGVPVLLATGTGYRSWAWTWGDFPEFVDLADDASWVVWRQGTCDSMFCVRHDAPQWFWRPGWVTWRSDPMPLSDGPVGGDGSVRLVLGADRAWSVVTVQLPPAADVPGESPFAADIAWALEEGIATGDASGGTFRPGAPMSRQATAAMLARWSGADTPACADAPFTDVSVDHPFCPEVARMVDAGFTDGYEDGTFRPTGPSTRQSLVAQLARVAGAELPDGPCSATFPDVGADHPFCHEIAWADDEGIVTGYADGLFRPGDTVSRQAAVAFLHRASPLLG